MNNETVDCNECDGMGEIVWGSGLDECLSRCDNCQGSGIIEREASNE